MRSLLNLTVMAFAAVAACATPNLDEPPPLDVEDAPNTRGSGQPVAPPAGSGSSAGEATPPPSTTTNRDADAGVNAGPQSKRWKGTLPSSGAVPFGGGQACNYRITLKQLKVDIIAASNGEIVAANVTATAFEEVLSANCNTPIPVNTHTYTLAKTTLLTNGFGHLELVGLSTNNPAASLVIEGDFGAAYPALSLKWHRTGYAPPLDWRVNAEIAVSLQ